MVRVRLAPGTRERMRDLAQLPIMVSGARSGGGTAPFVPLGQVATVAPGSGPAQIDHYQRKRVVTVGANVDRCRSWAMSPAT